MKKPISFLILLISFQLHATILTVTTPSDDKLAPSEGMLRYYIENANNGDTIIFSVDNVLLDTTLRINGGKIFIDGGNGVQIDVNNNGSVFNISCYSSDNIIIKNLIIKNGHKEKSSAMGGGMYAYVFGGTLLVDGCIFENNSVISDGDGQGGALRTNGGFFKNCRFLNNDVSGTGYSLAGGGIFAVGGEFINCIVAGNNSDYGGGVYASNAKFINCTITQNTSSTAGNGAGISCENSCEFYNCIVYNNKSGATEDNIDNSGCSFFNSAFESGNSLVGTNNNIGLTITPFIHLGTDSLNLYQNSACVDKGSIENITLPVSDIIGNSRISGSYIDIGAYEFASPLTVTRTDDDKTEPQMGMLRYAIENANSGDTITFEVDTVFADTTFSFGSQSLYIIGKDDNNVIIKGDKSFTLFYIYALDATTKIGIQNLTFINGGGSYGGLFGLFNYNAVFKNCIFTDNFGSKCGGASISYGEIYDCSFNNNKIMGDIYGTGGLFSSRSIIKNTEFINNGNYDDESSSAKQGGIEAYYCKLYNCKFINNYANSHGSVGGAEVSNSELTDCYFYKNHVKQDVQAYAGGVNSEKSNFINCTFKENIGAEIPGMGVSPPSYSGGAVATGGNFINCLFDGNKGKYAGGLYSASSTESGLQFNLINCTFINNTAYNTTNNATGGFILFGDYFSYMGVTTTVKNTISYGNTPNNIYNVNDNASISYCAIQDTLLEGTGNIRLDKSPFHSQLAEDNYWIKENSVCINAGDTVNISNILPDEDIFANSRINNDTIDIGVVEYNERISPTVTWPTTTQITYGDSAAEAINNDGIADIPGTFVVDESLFPQAGQEKIWMEFSPESDSIMKYKSIGDSILIDVAKATLLINVTDTTIKYGNTAPVYNLQYEGFVLGDNFDVIDVKPVVSVSNYDLLGVGQYPETIIASGGADNNYDLFYQPATLTINKASLTVTPQNTTVVFGDTEPSYKLIYEGFVKTDDVTVLDNEPSVSVSSYQSLDAGTYPDTIIASGGSDNNYDYIYQPATLTINKASLTVTAQDTTVVLGDAEPSYKLIYEGFVKTDDVTVLDNEPTASVNNYQSLNTGVYSNAIIVSGGEDNNYNFIYDTGTLTIVLSSSIYSSNINDIGIYPNPTANTIIIENIDEGAPFTLVSLSGTIIKEGIIDGTKITIDISTQPAGVYILTINNENYKIIKK